MNNLNGVHSKPDRDEWYAQYEDAVREKWVEEIDINEN